MLPCTMGHAIHNDFFEYYLLVGERFLKLQHPFRFSTRKKIDLSNHILLAFVIFASTLLRAGP